MLKDIDIPRSAYKKFYNWKNKNSDKVLFVKGARWVGKTYLVKKFVNKNFKKNIYINLLDDKGKDLIKIIENFNYKCNSETLTKTIKALFKTFEDNESTVVVVDEVQESYKVSDIIRKLNRYMECKFILIGSNLGRITPRHIYKKNKDLETINMYPLSFKEFLRAVNIDAFNLFNNIDINSNIDAEVDDLLMKYFKTYLIVGGYPTVVKWFIKDNDFKNVEKVQDEMISNYSMECARFLGDHKFILSIKDSFSYFVIALRIKDLNKYNPSKKIMDLKYFDVTQFLNSDYRKLMIWLLSSGVLYECDKSTDCKIVNRIFKEYFYFIDTGLLGNIIIRHSGLSTDILNILCDNYVFKTLYENNTNVSSFKNECNRYSFEIKNDSKPCEIKLDNNLTPSKMSKPDDKYSSRLVVPIYLFERLIKNNK